jgi:hypothetical protein
MTASVVPVPQSSPMMSMDESNGLPFYVTAFAAMYVAIGAGRPQPHSQSCLMPPLETKQGWIRVLATIVRWSVRRIVSSARV